MVKAPVLIHKKGRDIGKNKDFKKRRFFNSRLSRRDRSHEAARKTKLGIKKQRPEPRRGVKQNKVSSVSCAGGRSGRRSRKRSEGEN